MDHRFVAVVERLAPAHDRLMAMPPTGRGAGLPPAGMRGIYLFSEGDVHLYVGRTNDIRARYGRHCNPGATHRMAAFAFRLAREATGHTQAIYKAGEGSRSWLAADPAFSAAFITAKARIRTMDFRFVEVVHPIDQAILEVYSAVSLGTPYNDFDNH